MTGPCPVAAGRAARRDRGREPDGSAGRSCRRGALTPRVSAGIMAKRAGTPPVNTVRSASPRPPSLGSQNGGRPAFALRSRPISRARQIGGGYRSALRRCLAVPWAAHRSARPRQAERPPVAGNPPSRRAPFLGLHAPPGSPGRLLQRADPPHPHRVIPRGGKQHRIRDDLAVRSPDSSREILRAIGVDQHLRTSAPCRTVRLPRHVPDLPARELPLKLAPTLTVPHGLSPHPRSTRPSPSHVSHRQTRRDGLRPCQSTTPRRPQPTGCARGSLQELIRLFDAPRPEVSDLFSDPAAALVRGGVSGGPVTGHPRPVLRRRSFSDTQVCQPAFALVVCVWKARDAVGQTTFVPADEARRRLGMPR